MPFLGRSKAGSTVRDPAGPDTGAKMSVSPYFAPWCAPPKSPILTPRQWRLFGNFTQNWKNDQKSANFGFCASNCVESVDQQLCAIFQTHLQGSMGGRSDRCAVVDKTRSSGTPWNGRPPHEKYSIPHHRIPRNHPQRSSKSSSVLTGTSRDTCRQVQFLFLRVSF